MINPALFVALGAQTGDHATSDSIIKRLRKAKAFSAATAIRLDPASDAERKALDEAVGLGLVLRSADGRTHLNERAIADRNEGVGFALLLALLALASVGASVAVLVSL